MRILAFLLVALLVSGCAGTSISGFVRDARSGEPIPGAEVATERQATATNEEGLYQLFDLEPKERYAVHVTARGYEPLRRTVAYMEALDRDGRDLRRDFALIPEERPAPPPPEEHPREGVSVKVDLDRQRLRLLHRYMDTHDIGDMDAAIKHMIDRHAEP